MKNKDRYLAVSERFKKAREYREFNQTELGNKAGINPSILSLIEKGDRKPSIWTLIKVSTALEISSDYLIGLSPVMDVD